MKKLLTLLLIVGLGITTINAQDYQNAVGIKAGGGTLGTAGLNFKTFLTSKDAADLTLSFGNYGSSGSYYSFTGLYEKHQNAFDVDALNWYYGAGASVSYVTVTVTTPSIVVDNVVVSGTTISSSSFGFGVLGVVGIEYTIPDIPVNIAFDLEPGLFYGEYHSYNNNNNSKLYFGIQGAIAIRYAF